MADDVLSAFAKRLNDAEAELAECREERLKRERFRKWRNGLIGGSAAVMASVLAFVIRALLAAGASAEAARAQAELVRDSASRIRAIEIVQAEESAKLLIILSKGKE